MERSSIAEKENSDSSIGGGAGAGAGVLLDGDGAVRFAMEGRLLAGMVP